MAKQGRLTRRIAVVFVVFVAVNLGCSQEPSAKAGSICNLPKLIGWTRGDFDNALGSPSSVDILPNGRADTAYTYQGTSYYATFGNKSAQATMTSLLIETAEKFADADDLMFAVGFDPVPSVTKYAPSRLVYSTPGTKLVELAAMRSPLVGGDWSKVFVQLVPFDY